MLRIGIRYEVNMHSAKYLLVEPLVAAPKDASTIGFMSR